jgi:hypothetical protein
MTVTVHAHAVPGAPVRRLGPQRLRQRGLQREEFQRRAPGGAVAALAFRLLRAFIR